MKLFDFFTKNKHDPVIPLTYTQISWFGVAAILFALLTFFAGYFLGQRYALEHVVDRVQEESFADKINYSLYTLSDQDFVENDEADEESEEGEEENIPSQDTIISENIESEKDEVGLSKQDVDAGVTLAVQDKPSAHAPVQETNNTGAHETKYVAQLVGFGTLIAARECCDRFIAKGYPVEIQKRLSKTKRGRSIVWYQVTTKPCVKESEAQELADSIGKAERIKNIAIVKV